jgi:hypothetical protein
MSARAEQKPQAEPRTDINSRTAASYFGTGADAARAIGEAYLRQLGVEPIRASILEHSSRAIKILGAAGSQKAALASLASAVHRDFQEGRVLLLEGWVVSRTEMEICALTLLPAAN